MKLCLIIDDDKEHLLKAKQFASTMNFSVVSASHASEGLRICQQSKPDIILLTSTLAEMDGLEFMQTLKQRVPDKRFNVLMYSATPSASHVQDAKKMGVNLYLIKPLVKDQLRAALDRLGLFD